VIRRRCFPATLTLTLTLSLSLSLSHCDHRGEVASRAGLEDDVDPVGGALPLGEGPVEERVGWRCERLGRELARARAGSHDLDEEPDGHEHGRGGGQTDGAPEERAATAAACAEPGHRLLDDRVASGRLEGRREAARGPDALGDADEVGQVGR
jgi:hypothetical protein